MNRLIQNAAMCCGVLCATVPAVAQGLPSGAAKFKSVTTYHFPEDSGPGCHGVIAADANALGPVLEWTDTQFAGGTLTMPRTTYLLDTGFTYAWSAKLIEEDLVLVSGGVESTQTAAAHGAVALVRFNRAQEVLELVSTVSTGAFMPVDVTWEPTNGIMFGLSPVNGGVFVTPWSGPQQALPTAWAHVADSFANSMRQGFVALPAAVGIGVEFPALPFRTLTGAPEPERAWFDGAAWQVEMSTGGTPVDVFYGLPNSQPSVVIELPTPIGHSSTIPVATSVSGSAGSVDLVNVSTSSVVTSLSWPAGHNAVLQPPQAWWDEPGYMYRLEGVGFHPSQTFRPLIRYGQPTTQVGNMMMTHGHIPAALLHLDSPEFGVAVTLSRPDSEVGPRVVTAGLNVAFRYPSDTEDPLVAGSDPVLLDGVAGFSQTVRFPPDLYEVQAHFDFPIPSNASLDGVVVLFQVLVADADETGQLSDLVVSDVFGSKIRAVIPGSAAGQSAADACSVWSSAIVSTGGYDWVQNTCASSMNHQ